ncbi:ABC transporter permease [Paenibacillus donghaensis]|uniref:ABC transporter permease n=1 Tax=Paenibacillus donghaensis TaxID=414771 RepID=UPI0014714432|nr:ABC transporter permease [Paenibacillus donghaensis]
MNLLTRFELRKILRRKSTLVGIIIILAVAVFLEFMSVSGENVVGEDGNDISGLSAISLSRQNAHRLAGELNTESIAAAIDRHLLATKKTENLNKTTEEGISLSNKAYGKYEQKDVEINNLIRIAYSSSDKYDYYIMDKLSTHDASAFYQKRMDKINKYLNMEFSYGNYSTDEKDYFKAMNGKINVPFKFDYSSGWMNLMRDLDLVILVTAFVISLSVSRVFAGEYQSGADSIILSSRYGRSKLISAKLRASFLFSTGLYFGSILFLTVIMLSVYGQYGSGSNIQIILFQSPYPLTIFQTYLASVLIGYIACLLIMSITLLFSARMKSPFSVILCSVVLLLAPLFIPDSKSSRLFNNLLNLLPSKMLDGYSVFARYESYHVFNRIIAEPWVIGAVALTFTLAFLPFTYHSFKHHQVV